MIDRRVGLAVPMIAGIGAVGYELGFHFSTVVPQAREAFSGNLSNLSLDTYIFLGGLVDIAATAVIGGALIKMWNRDLTRDLKHMRPVKQQGLSAVRYGSRIVRRDDMGPTIV